MSDYQLYIGDCAQVMREQIADGAIDLTVTSPPYDNLRKYNGYHFDFEAIAAELWRVTKPGGVVVWVVADATINGSETGTSFMQALHFKGLGFNLHDTMIWDKGWCQYGDTRKRYAGTWEYVFIFSKGSPASIFIIKDRPNLTAGSVRQGRWDRRVTGNNSERVTRSLPHKVNELSPRKSIWTYDTVNIRWETSKIGVSHPAAFPEGLARDHIISWSNPGDVVLDPMCGSGTTGKQAVLLGRHFIGIDISAEYIDGIARPRIEKAASQASQLSLLEQGDGLGGTLHN